MKNRVKRTLCLLSVFLLVFLFCSPAYAEQGDVSFNYAGGTYTYNFSYLDAPSNKYNKNLAVTCLAMINYKRSEDLFRKAGFTFFTDDSFNLANTNDGIYYSLAARNINNTTYVAITIEGTIDIQWYGNVDMGTGTDHAGFCRARDIILNDLVNNFLPSVNHASALKFLITGHSRGASTANLLAAKLNKIGSVNGIAVDKSDVYAYTFAAANTTTVADAHGTDYDNIFNIANRDDFVTVVPPAKIGYTVYGKTLTLPSKTFNSEYTELFNQMQTVYKKMTGTEFTMLKNGAVYPLIMTETMSNLSGNTPGGYYNNRYSVGAGEYSCYDFMVKYADYRSNNPPLVSAANTFFNNAINSEFSVIVNYAINGGNMWSSHYPAVYTAWLAATSDEMLFAEKTFNRVTIDTDAKIKVYDRDNNLVGIVNDGKINNNIPNPVSIEANGSEYSIFLPGDSEYSLTLVGKTDGSFAYMVEKCTDTGSVTDSGSYEFNITAGEILSAKVFSTSSTQPPSAYAFSEIASTPDDEPEAPSNPSANKSFLDKIRDFFLRFINWFRGLFS